MTIAPVIVITGHATDETGHSDLQTIVKTMALSGPVESLEKPIKPEPFLEQVRASLDPRGA